MIQLEEEFGSCLIELDEKAKEERDRKIGMKYWQLIYGTLN